MEIITNKGYPRGEQQQDVDKTMSEGQGQAGKTVAGLRKVFGTWNKQGGHKAHRNPLLDTLLQCSLVQAASKKWKKLVFSVHFQKGCLSKESLDCSISH